MSPLAWTLSLLAVVEDVVGKGCNIPPPPVAAREFWLREDVVAVGVTSREAAGSQPPFPPGYEGRVEGLVVLFSVEEA